MTWGGRIETFNGIEREGDGTRGRNREREKGRERGRENSTCGVDLRCLSHTLSNRGKVR